MGWSKSHGVPGDECVDNRAADVLNIDGIGEGLFRVAARRADREAWRSARRRRRAAACRPRVPLAL